MTTLQQVGNYNNFYEFTTDKEGVAAAAAGFVSRPWTVAVDGMVHKPKVFDLDEVLRLGPLEERVYRMRCVEGWSMVIPWAGLPLARLLDRVEPMGGAKYVAFQTLLDPARFPGQRGSVLDWPYVEGLRMDEAMHPLTILAAGLYGRELPAQNGAPLRLVVPWKYGFKGIKSIVKITLTADRPPSTWNAQAPSEYGFFSNVNPNVPHPRWSQATEQRIGESGPAADAAVQRVRRAGRPPLRRHGPAGQLSEPAARNIRRHEEAALLKVDRFTKSVVLLNCTVPVALLGWDAWGGRLGANPVNFAIRTTGILSLIFLVLSLAVTPASRITGWGWLGQFRRMLGLYAFFHAALHFLLFFGFDRAASVSDTASEILKRPYLMVGMVGLVLMVPLAATSTNGMIKRLGPARWKALHRLAYVAAAAGALHFYMLVKADVTPADRVRRGAGRCFSSTAWSPITGNSASDARKYRSAPPAAAPARGRSPGPGN